MFKARGRFMAASGAVLVGIAILLAVDFLVMAGSARSPEAVSDEARLRRPFSLELPEIGGPAITAPEAVVPTADLHTLRFRVKVPYSESINYGKIYTWINGESAGTIQEIRAARDGYIVACNLESKPRFRLRPGKNVVEIQAIDQQGQSFYASYVLLASGNAPVDQARAVSATIEYISVTTGDDRQPPAVYLISPNSSIRLLTASGVVKVSGIAFDEGGVTSVTIDGQRVALSPAKDADLDFVKPRTVGIVSMDSTSAVFFEQMVSVAADATAMVIEARDRAGNLTRLTLPVRRPVAAISSEFKGRKFAVIIGISRYKYHDGGLADLAYSDADARAVRDLLLRKEGGGFSSSDLLYLENDQATIDSVNTGLKQFLPRAGPNDLVFVFIAGHGAPDPYAPQRLYFLVHDSKVADMPHTALPMSDLQDVLDHSIRAQRVVVFIDSCHSAGLSGERLVAARGLENNLINLQALRLFREEGRAVLTSSDVNEVSQESERWGGGHGIFTHAILEGLRGEADTNSDRRVTAGELFAYVRDRVGIETAFRQNPVALPGLSADLTLAVVPGK